MCQCDCGNTIISATNKLLSGNTKFCGCYHKNRVSELNKKNLENQTFGKLIAIKDIGTNKWHRRIWRCKCQCGNTTIVTSNALLRGATKSCGNCGVYRNGRQTSWIALELHQMVGNLGWHNYYIGKHNYDIILPNSNIIIEYNSWKWHKNKQKRDNNRTKYAIKYGWKVLHIKSNGYELPPQELLDKSIFELLFTHQKQVTLTLQSWKDAKQRDTQKSKGQN